jgi:hypothetical protein
VRLDTDPARAYLTKEARGMYDTERPRFHWIHGDDPDDGSPVRPGATCGPQCDLFEDPEPMAGTPDVVFVGTVGQFLDGIEAAPGEIIEVFGR